MTTICLVTRLLGNLTETGSVPSCMTLLRTLRDEAWSSAVRRVEVDSVWARNHQAPSVIQRAAARRAPCIIELRLRAKRCPLRKGQGTQHADESADTV